MANMQAEHTNLQYGRLTYFNYKTFTRDIVLLICAFLNIVT